MAHPVKIICHWYYQSLSHCVAPQGEVFVEMIIGSRNLAATGKECCKGLSVAVFVAGALKSLIITSTIHNLISHFVKGNVDVDDYVSVTTASTNDYRSNNGYTSHAQPDPFLPSNICFVPIITEDSIRK